MSHSAPIASRREVSTTVHGDTRIDEYGWLRDRDDPETLAYLEAENAYTQDQLAHLAPLRQQLFEEIRSRIVETDMSVPVKRDQYWYYTRTVEGLDYPIFCRRPFHGEALPPRTDGIVEGEEILLDENVEAKGFEFFSTGVVAICPDHKFLALAVDTVGNERHALTFRAIGADVHPHEIIDNVSYGFAWSTDSKTVFYTRVDDAWRPYQIWRHVVGSDPSDDVLVFQEDDARFNVGVGLTRDKQAIIISASSSTTTETWTIPAAEPTSDLRLLAGRVHGVEHAIDHATRADGTHWWTKITNQDGAEDFRLDVAPDSDGDLVWETVVAHRPGLRLEGAECFTTFMVLSEREDAEVQLRIVPLTDSPNLTTPDALTNSWVIKAAESPQSTWLDHNAEFDTDVVRIAQNSMSMPTTISQVSVADRSTTVLKRQEVPGGYDPNDYVTYRTWATAKDGAKVPVSIVHARSILAGGGVAGDPPAQPAPCLLYGYGSYEIAIDPSFSTTRLSLLDRGVVFAIAHVRGGAELGRRWYNEGHLEFKENSFDDFIAVADHLITTGVTTPGRLAARGGSAGGLLMGAVANRGPDRFCALLAEVPFVDALNTMLDPSLPLTVGEYEEWGNPTDDLEAYFTIKGYAPYENVIATNPDGSPFTYPAMLLTAGLNDTRVGYWEPAKFVARLRFVNPNNPVLLRTEMGVGHGGPSGRYESWREEAFVLAWLLDQLGVASAT